MLKNFLFFTVLLLCASSLFGQTTDYPNVVFILVDDLGYHDLGVTGSDFYETPHIDELASSSYQFTQGYSASPVCSPARASIMTGVTPAIHKVTDWIGAPEAEKWRDYGRHTRLLPPAYNHVLESSLLTLPEALSEAGYETFFAGKWHIGGEGSYPEDHGFDINIGGYEKGSPIGGYFAPYDNPKMEQGPDGENLSMRLANETSKFIEKEHQKPFFAMLSFYAVHGPIQTTEAKWAKYRKKASDAGLADQGYEMERRLPIRTVQDNPVYAGLVEAMDDAVGKVMETLKNQGLEDNTIVVFTSDHGGVASGDAYSTSNLPLRGGKGYQWEGGIRVPYFIKVPGQKDLVYLDVPASGVDFLPTILDLAGVHDVDLSGVEGKSLVPAMNGQHFESRPLFWHYPHYGNQGGDPSSTIRDGDWKLIYYWEDGKVELYNLLEDPSEQHDRSALNPEVSQKLFSQLISWLESTNANKPVPDPQYDEELHQQVLDKARTVKMPSLEQARLQMLRLDWKPNADWWGSKVTRD
ncbi:sulfatase [Algoriphagus halophytocola]|uniref:Sulfatase n=1 Tax=Algoriphagus halophytocola TaxID=2991499 RepID=A0ABY6MH47_9BACT|nr:MULTISPECIES: sulfatase [unclassified Algoriphagus]UZD23105.1 sulfatase [Algoriphagus sp. TR-M5]WBL44397.1 sulfatase [Algoriphagus sp. TR-M9]